MAEVRYISTCTVAPPASHDELTQRIELTPWDLHMLPVDYIEKGLLFVKPTPQQGKEKKDVINLLKTSLSHTLHHFFPFAGRLATRLHDDNTTSFFIDCNGAGAEFIHASADITMASILDPIYVPRIVHSFFPLNGVINFQGKFQPLLAVQVTELIDGIFIGCSVNHTVSDGTSFWHFFNSWSEICRGGADHISRPPILKRWFLDDTQFPIRLHVSNDEQFTRRYTPPLLEERVFHFTPEKIAGLKAKAKAESGRDRISSLQALLGHIWRSVTRVRCLDPDLEISYRLLIGTRSKLHPPLPEEYFGNMVQVGMATAKAGELLEGGLGWAAGLLNEVVMSHTDAVVRESLESWVKNPKLLTVDGVIGASYGLITGSSPRFNVYGNDFGWGRPVAVRSGAANKFDGKLTVFPGQEEGSVDIEACLLPQTLRSMADDAEFMHAVTI
ncbi:hypothetical protein HHK36_002615 [Tetracentron sinense]|uniref:HXXXD-type acyl-transferase family protein n=1 Tax=Tetracentron sinense TaxID=13715 RepID=A0A834ZRS9_TETSI|nr:hypothetical protein HHK36_002615 [Tetracentron sinense]